MKGRSGMWERLSVLTFALLVVAGIVGAAFAFGYILGKILL
jgi:disulfide bond formation protein DsbB